MLLSADQVVDILLAFDAITGCDSASLSSVATERKQPGRCSSNPTDLTGFCKGNLTENIAISADNFICKIHGLPEVDTCNKA